MITMKFDLNDLRTMKLFCYLDTNPEELDNELMENVVDLFIANTNLIETRFEIVVSCRLEPLEELYDGRELLFARYEPPPNNG
jgi:hypothetical protein